MAKGTSGGVSAEFCAGVRFFLKKAGGGEGNGELFCNIMMESQTRVLKKFVMPYVERPLNESLPSTSSTSRTPHPLKSLGIHLFRILFFFSLLPPQLQKEQLTYFALKSQHPEDATYFLELFPSSTMITPTIHLSFPLATNPTAPFPREKQKPNTNGKM